MLIEFKVKNFRSIKEEQTLSMVASRDKKLPENLIEAPGGLKLLKAVGIYGANASGKSNLIKALYAMLFLIENSAQRMKIGDEIWASTPFKLDATLRDQPTRFTLSFVVEGVIYEYSFSVTKQKVVSERLETDMPKEKTMLFDRRLTGKGGDYAWQFNKELGDRETLKLLEARTRENCLALSRGADFDIKPLSNIYTWFRRHKFYGMGHDSDLDAFSTARLCEGVPAFKERVKELLQDADVGIEDFKLYKNSRVVAVHLQPETGEQEEFDFFDESNGTNRFFALLKPWFLALSNGDTIVFDEFDHSLHPLLARKLLQYFQHPSNNKNGAQLIFATQDVTLMDARFFRRDQLCIVEKKRNQASECFSLYDFDERPRNNEALRNNYMSGRYGGIPIFGRAWERLEDEI